LRRIVLTLLSVVALVVVAAGCGGGGGGGDSGGGGTVEADGSSTVGPYVTRAAELFGDENPGVKITVGISGSGGGFDRFCRGETDLSNASREIKEEEEELCGENGVEFTRFDVANDALTVIRNPGNDWAACLTTDQLNTIWEPGSKVGNWSDVADDFPGERMRLYGPGTDSGTFDYFTEVINGKEGASRTDFSASEDDNVILQGVAGEKGGLGYLGFSYYEENQGRVAAVEVDSGSGCVAPSAATAQDGSYTPLSRPLFVYVKNESLERDEVADFMRFMLDNQAEIAESAQFVPLNDEQIAEFEQQLEEQN
jgi:phosphate transport system substrate-binding protein